MRVDWSCQGEHDVLEARKEISMKPYKFAPVISLNLASLEIVNTYVRALDRTSRIEHMASKLWTQQTLYMSWNYDRRSSLAENQWKIVDLWVRETSFEESDRSVSKEHHDVECSYYSANSLGNKY